MYCMALSVLCVCVCCCYRCLYISGVPGTGKTATVHEVMCSLKEAEAEGLVPQFKFVEINGMRMTDPYQAYPLIWKVCGCGWVWVCAYSGCVGDIQYVYDQSNRDYTPG